MKFWKIPSSLFGQDNGKEESIIIGSIALEDTRESKTRLTLALLKQLLPGHQLQEGDLELGHNSLGRPQLMHPKVSTSYSYSSNTLWAAVGKVATLGIDVAASSEFEDSYPFHRVFHAEELALVQQLYRNRKSAAAFLWACKEAVAKAMGTGFHTIEPYDIQITSCSPDRWGITVGTTPSKHHIISTTCKHMHWIAVTI